MKDLEKSSEIDKLGLTGEDKDSLIEELKNELREFIIEDVIRSELLSLIQQIGKQRERLNKLDEQIKEKEEEMSKQEETNTPRTYRQRTLRLYPTKYKTEESQLRKLESLLSQGYNYVASIPTSVDGDEFADVILQKEIR